MPKKTGSVIGISQIIWNRMFPRTLVKMEKVNRLKGIGKEN
jgi:hypothetical protein